MRLTLLPGFRRRAALALVAVLVAACGSGSPSPRTGSLPPELTDDPLLPTSPTLTTPRPPTAPPVRTPVVGGWPNGWAEEFCAAWEQVVIAQELAVDVGRALDEDDRDDALALAVELEGTGEVATELLAALPEWEPASAPISQLSQLMDLGRRVGRSYRRFLDDGREPALERAQTLAGEMRPIVDGVMADLADLADQEGLACPGMELRLEAP